MLTRREALQRSLRASPLVALGSTVPGFLAATARAAEPGRDNVLVVVELNGGNDGLNTAVPYADDLYHKARPTLRLDKSRVVRVTDAVGLNPGLRPLERLLGRDQLAVVQGVGYPNPDRSHFESMDVWHTADPSRKAGGWLGRALNTLPTAAGTLPGVHVGAQQLPLALAGATGGVPTLVPGRPFDLDLGGRPGRPGDAPSAEDRRKLIDGLTAAPATADAGLLGFVQRSALQTYASLDRLRQVMGDEPRDGNSDAAGGDLGRQLHLVARMVAGEFGTRVFYVSAGGFDTHAGQAETHERLLGQLAAAVDGFFRRLEASGHANRVALMTFSEFGRRVQENGSRGTDHGAASCLLLAGPAVRGGVHGAAPSLRPEHLDAGDLRHHTDFRRVYASLLGGWLGCRPLDVLGGDFEPLNLLR